MNEYVETMAKDYKNRPRYQHKQAPEKEISLVWKWGLVLLILAIFGGCLIWLKSTTTQSSPALVVKQDSALAEPQKETIDLSFYHVLPEREVIIPEYEIESRKRAERKQLKDKKTAAITANYELQAGAYQQFAEADKVKARLLLLGMQVRIEKVTLDRRVWYRVKVGPFQTLNQADKIRKQLKAEQISSAVMKRTS
jgi:cell division protein FtsN